MNLEKEDEVYSFDLMGYYLLFGGDTLKFQKTRRLITEYKLFKYMRIKMRCMLQLVHCEWDPIRYKPPIDGPLLRECFIFLFLIYLIIYFNDHYK